MISRPGDPTPSRSIDKDSLLERQQAEATMGLEMLPQQPVDLVELDLGWILSGDPPGSPRMLGGLSDTTDPVLGPMLMASLPTFSALLARLIERFPNAFFNTPPLDVWLLENPRLVRDLPVSALLALVACEECPDWVLAQAAQVQDETLQRTIGQHLNTPLAILRNLQSASPWAAVREAVSLHANIAPAGAIEVGARLSHAVINALTRQYQPRHSNSRFNVFQQPPDKSKEGPDFSYSSCLSFLLLSNQLRLDTSESWSAQHPLFAAVVADTTATPLCSGNASLERLSNDQDWHVRAAVARHPSTPPKILARLVADSVVRVRRAIAKNPNAPTALLEQLADDEEIAVYSLVVQHPATPTVTRQRLLERSLLENSHNSAGFLKRLNPKVLKKLLYGRWRMARHLTVAFNVAVACFKEGLKKVIKGLTVVLPQNSMIPHCFLLLLKWTLSRPIDDNGHYKAAPNLFTSMDISFLEACLMLAKYLGFWSDSSQIFSYGELSLFDIWRHKVRRAVAAHPGTPALILERLANERHSPPGVAINPNIWTLEWSPAREDFLIRLRIATNPTSPLHLLERLAFDHDKRIRRRLALHPAAPAHVLQALAKDASIEVRQAVASHCNTPAETLEQLADDTEWQVRNEIAWNPASSLCALERLLDYNAKIDVISRLMRHPAHSLWEIECRLYGSSIVWIETAFNGYFKTLSFSLDPPPPLSPDTWEIAERILSRYAARWVEASKPTLNRLLALLSPWAPPWALAAHYRSPWWEERLAIATHPATPLAIRQHLAEDTNVLVRTAARITLPPA